MGPTWGPSGPHVGPMNFAIWDGIEEIFIGPSPVWSVKLMGPMVKWQTDKTVSQILIIGIPIPENDLCIEMGFYCLCEIGKMEFD